MNRIILDFVGNVVIDIRDIWTGECLVIPRKQQSRQAFQGILECI